MFSLGKYRTMFVEMVARGRRSMGKKARARRSLLSQMPKGGVCAEIGVWMGDFSEEILKVTSPRRLHLIDPWEFQVEFSGRMYGGTLARNQEDMDVIFQAVKGRFGKMEKVVINRGRSETELQRFPDGYFDWVYIDGNHDYGHVIIDLNLCYAKIGKGGYIAGDDFLWGEKLGFPVKRAVNDFVNLNGIVENLNVIGSQFFIRV